MRRAALAIAAVVACGGGSGRGARPVVGHAVEPARAITATERVLPLLPDGAQVVVELDLARLRANAVVGPVATRAFERLGGEAKLPGLPAFVQGSPLAAADAVVLAAYGVGTAQASTLTIITTKAELAGGTRLAADLVALGDHEWIVQAEARAAIAQKAKISANAELIALRDHAMLQGATGAVLRVTARLPFDARVALARQTGLDATPARMSVWADVADDLAIVVDADAADAGEQPPKAAHESARKFATTLKMLLATAADDPTVRALGVGPSLSDARLIVQGAWVRAMIAVGPRHLARVVQRANELLGGAS